MTVKQYNIWLLFIFRMWSVNTGHCLKIFRGHRDTVMAIKVLGDLLISGSKDKSCKGMEKACMLLVEKCINFFISYCMFVSKGNNSIYIFCNGFEKEISSKTTRTILVICFCFVLFRFNDEQSLKIVTKM